LFKWLGVAGSIYMKARDVPHSSIHRNEPKSI
jgi:hypothetical protein